MCSDKWTVLRNASLRNEFMPPRYIAVWLFLVVPQVEYSHEPVSLKNKCAYEATQILLTWEPPYVIDLSRPLTLMCATSLNTACT